MPSKTFRGDLLALQNRLSQNQPFAFARFGDGEMMIIHNESLDLRDKGSGEFRFDATQAHYQPLRQALRDSFQHQDTHYYVGIACRCCVGDQKHQQMKEESGLPEPQLTWANLFVNANYTYFLEHITPLFTTKSVYLVANAQSTPEHLPFPVQEFWPIGPDAWVQNERLWEEIEPTIVNTCGAIFLFAAGPFANILVHKAWQQNPNNTYLDIGSVYDKILGLIPTRGYLRGAPTLRKVCVW